MNKIIKTILFLSLSFFALHADSQNPMYLEKDSIQNMNRWTIKLGFNSVDSYESGNLLNNFFDLDTEAFHGYPVKLDIEYRISDLVAFEVSGSQNKWLAGTGVIDGELLTEDQTYYAADLNVKLYYDEVFHWFKNTEWVELYSKLGVGYFKVNAGGFSVNAGLGANVWLTNHFGLNLDILAKWPLDPSPAIYDTRKTQYSLGIAYRFKSQDKDKDGIYDYNDYCPNIPGTVKRNGCPEKKPYLRKKTTVPTTTNKITATLDRDKDGVIDTIDNCPNLAGVSSNNGCPPLDSDGDGVMDSKDNCPKIYGEENNSGCPKASAITSTDEVAINFLAEKIEFETGSANFTQETYSVLENIVAYINKYSGSKFRIEGHTDSIGSYDSNRILSQERTDAVKAFFIKNGISALNLEAIGLGERQPIKSNMYKSGRKVNRRVEIKRVN